MVRLLPTALTAQNRCARTIGRAVVEETMRCHVQEFKPLPHPLLLDLEVQVTPDSGVKCKPIPPL